MIHGGTNVESAHKEGCRDEKKICEAAHFRNQLDDVADPTRVDVIFVFHANVIRHQLAGAHTFRLQIIVRLSVIIGKVVPGFRWRGVVRILPGGISQLRLIRNDIILVKRIRARFYIPFLIFQEDLKRYLVHHFPSVSKRLIKTFKVQLKLLYENLNRKLSIFCVNLCYDVILSFCAQSLIV